MGGEFPKLFEIKEECCGCSACYAICEQNAIKMLGDEEGFLYPVIDKNFCIHCMSCMYICPIRKWKRER